MSQLAIVLLLGLAGPLLALPKRFALPVAVGELLIGVIFGHSGFGLVTGQLPSLQMLSQIGFALVMMVTASHIDLNRFVSRKDFLLAVRNVVAIAVAASVLTALIVGGLGLSKLWGVVFVLLMSSSAAVFLPVMQQLPGFKAPAEVMVQVTLADLLAVLLLPLVEEPQAFGTEALGVGLMLVAALAIYFLLRWAAKSGKWKSLRQVSTDRHFGLELRLSLILLLAAISFAQSLHVTIMLAGFGLGLAIAANGVPHRLAKQLFAVSEGFFAPVFFVLLGASIDVRNALANPGLMLMAGSLGLAAILAHLVVSFFGVSWKLTVLSGAQLGVPAAAVSIGLAEHLMSAGQGAAIMCGALITILASAIASARLTVGVASRASAKSGK